MAKIRNSNPKQSGGGYERLVGDADMASIFTKAQSTVISNGIELEKIISNKSTTIDDLDAFIDEKNNPHQKFQMELGEVFVCHLLNLMTLG